jgi:H+/gluconate symporter-like permease
MEGWIVQDFFVQPINWVVALVLAIPVGIIANLLTNPLRNWWARRSASRAERRSRELEQHLRSIEAMTQSSRELGLTLAALATLLLITFALGSAVIALSSFAAEEHRRSWAILGGMCYAISVLVGIAAISTIDRVRNFEAFRERTERTIADLKTRAPRQL